uniref:EIN3-binding F-box protein 1 n=1 Tax=Solanum tuberosum TaxID=4113 RepID=M1D017_SOLTU
MAETDLSVTSTHQLNFTATKLATHLQMSQFVTQSTYYNNGNIAYSRTVANSQRFQKKCIVYVFHTKAVHQGKCLQFLTTVQNYAKKSSLAREFVMDYDVSQGELVMDYDVSQGEFVMDYDVSQGELVMDYDVSQGELVMDYDVSQGELVMDLIPVVNAIDDA